MSQRAFSLFALTLTLVAVTLLPAHHHSMLGPSIASADDLTLDDFVLYAEEDVKLEMIAESIGHVSSNGQANIAEGSCGILTGHLHALDRIKNEGEITIDGDVVTNQYIDDDGVLSVTGQMIEYANLAPLTIPSPSFSAGGPDIEVPPGGVHTLSPGSYGRVKVRDGADLYLSGGDYYIDEFDTDPQAIVWVDLTGGPITINVVTELDIDDGVAIIISPEDSGTTTDITINALQEAKIEIEHDARLRGTLNAPNAEVKFEENSALEGAVYAREISLDSGVRFIHHDYYIPLQLTDPSINYRSIGTAGGILHQTGGATVLAGATLVTFTSTTLPPPSARGTGLPSSPAPGLRNSCISSPVPATPSSSFRALHHKTTPQPRLRSPGPILTFRPGRTIETATWLLRTAWRWGSATMTVPFRAGKPMPCSPLTIQRPMRITSCGLPWPREPAITAPPGPVRSLTGKIPPRSEYVSGITIPG